MSQPCTIPKGPPARGSLRTSSWRASISDVGLVHVRSMLAPLSVGSQGRSPAMCQHGHQAWLSYPCGRGLLVPLQPPRHSAEGAQELKTRNLQQLEPSPLPCFKQPAPWVSLPARAVHGPRQQAHARLSAPSQGCTPGSKQRASQALWTVGGVLAPVLSPLVSTAAIPTRSVLPEACEGKDRERPPWATGQKW